MWKQPAGDYVYGRFELEAAEYNVAPRRPSSYPIAADAAPHVEVRR